MNRLTMVEQEKQVAEESLATQLTLAREELMTTQNNCEQLKKELAVSKDKLSELRWCVPCEWCSEQMFSLGQQSLWRLSSWCCRKRGGPKKR